jgi:hypothetical protein
VSVVVGNGTFLRDFVQDAYLLRLYLALLGVFLDRRHRLSVLLQVAELHCTTHLLVRSTISRQIPREVKRELILNLYCRVSWLLELFIRSKGLFVPRLSLYDSLDYFQARNALHVLTARCGLKLLDAICPTIFHLLFKDLSPP